MNMIPAFQSAMDDRALRRDHAREVYFWLYRRLDVLDFRPVKHSEIEKGLGIEDYTVSRAVATLIERGYIDRGPRAFGRVRAYRLVHAVPLLPAAGK